MVPWPLGVISSGQGIGISDGELLAWDDVAWDGIISSDESVSLTSQVLWSGGHPTPDFFKHMATKGGDTQMKAGLRCYNQLLHLHLDREHP